MEKTTRDVLTFITQALIVLAVVFTPSAYGQSLPGSTSQDQEHAAATLKSAVKEIVPGKPFKMILLLTMQPGWHTYYKEPGDAGMPTKINWLLPDQFRASEIVWPEPEKFNDAGIITYGYENQAELTTTIYPPANLSESKNVTIKADVKWLVCKDLCVPGQASLTITLPVAVSKSMIKGQIPISTDTTSDTQLISTTNKEADKDSTTSKKNFNKLDNLAYTANKAVHAAPVTAFVSILDRNLHTGGLSTTSSGLPMYLLLAFVGGFILNFMPCVLPVISIKLVSFIEEANSDPKHVFAQGMTFALGILSSFMLLAAFVIVLKSLGHDVGWGFQFQHPGFLVAMASLVLAFSLSLFGLFHIHAPLPQTGLTELAGEEGFVGTFFKGVLATVLSTPCTAPFLGTALGFAFTQNAGIILLIFFTVGLGLASPYIVLTANPKLMPHLPKPGAWMETLKEFMGFLLLATVLWLVWVLGQQVGANAMLFTLCFLLNVSFACWMIGRLVDLTTPATKKYCIWALAFSFVAISYYYLIASTPGIGKPIKTNPQQVISSQENRDGSKLDWQPFSVELLDNYLSLHKTVFLDFTADWCLNCKANEKAVLDSKPVIEKLKSLNAVTIKADWTKQNPTITKLLKKFGRSGVPLYVIFPADKPDNPIVLPEIITPSIVLHKLDQAGPSKT